MRRILPRVLCSPMHALLLAGGITCLAAAGCESSEMDWSDPTVVSPAGDVRLEIDRQGHAIFVTDSTAAIRPPAGRGACERSFRVARQQDGSLVAVWWSVRADSSAVLDAAVSRDGGAHWSEMVPVDTTDISSAGCARPAPAITASQGFVHVAYSARGRDGAGVFYSHSMTQGRSYEPPIAMIYGDRLTPAAVGAAAGLVAVAYEDPNGPTPQIGLALSRTWGHSFDQRSRVSVGAGASTDPQVAVTEHTIAVSWIERPRMDAGDAPEARIVRVAHVP